MIQNPIFFYISALILLIFAFISLFQKNIIYSLLSAIIVFFAGAVFFYILGSEYNAIIQAAVYGLAVPIIIGLSIMLTTGSANKPKESYFSVVIPIIACIFLMAFIYVVMISLSMLPDTFNVVNMYSANSYEVISAFAKGIFINYVWDFELVSILLTIIIAGFTLFRKRGI